MHYGCGTVQQKLSPSFPDQLFLSVAKYEEHVRVGPAPSRAQCMEQQLSELARMTAAAGFLELGRIRIVSSRISPMFKGDTALPLAFWGEKICPPPPIFYYNMLLGIILFYKKKGIFAFLQNPRD